MQREVSRSSGPQPLWRTKRRSRTASDQHAKIVLDKAFVLIEGHPLFVRMRLPSSEKQKQILRPAYPMLRMGPRTRGRAGSQDDSSGFW